MNSSFLQWLETSPEVLQAGGLSNAAYSVNLSEEAFLSKATRAFEEIKAHCNGWNDPEEIRVTASGLQFSAELDRDVIEGLYDMLIAEIVAEIREHLTEDNEMSSKSMPSDIC